jgi:hypothetical protein
MAVAYLHRCASVDLSPYLVSARLDELDQQGQSQAAHALQAEFALGDGL